MDKKLPVVLTFFNVLVSGISSYSAWPLRVFAGLEIESTGIAVVGAAIGTILGLLKVVKRRLVPLLLVLGILFVLAVSTYSYILSRPGASPPQLFFALFLFLIIFLVFFYLITYLEKALAQAFPTKKDLTEKGL